MTNQHRTLTIYILVLFAVTLALRLVLIGYYNNNLGGIELNVVYGIQRILLGQHLYQDPTAGVFAVMQYTPLYYHICAGLSRLSGIGGHDVQAIFELCRVVALTSNLLTVAIVASIIRNTGFSWFTSMTFAMPALMILTSHFYTRGDSLYLLFFVAAVASCLRCKGKHGLLYLVLAVVLAACCIAVKQSGILVVGVIAGGLLVVDRRPLMAIGAAGASLLLAAIIVWLCTGNTPLDIVYMNIGLGLKNGYDAGFLLTMFTSRYFMDLVPFYGLGALIVWRSIRQIRERQYRVLALGTAMAWTFAVVTGLKKGSSNNYFTEFLVLVLLSLPLLLRHVRQQRFEWQFREMILPVHQLIMVAFLVLITSKTMGFFSGVVIEHGYRNEKAEYYREAELLRYFRNTLHVRQGQHIFFTERRFLDNLFIDYAILPTKDVTSMVYIADSSTYNYSRFISGMNRGLVNYIVTSQQRDGINICSDSLPFVWFDTNKFHLVTSRDGFSIYRFSDPAVAAMCWQNHDVFAASNLMVR